MKLLPPGYRVVADSAVGYSFLDDQGNIIVQHPKDTESIRALIWQKYEEREKARRAK